jgi:hypothetical protein
MVPPSGSMSPSVTLADDTEVTSGYMVTLLAPVKGGAKRLLLPARRTYDVRARDRWPRHDLIATLDARRWAS